MKRILAGLFVLLLAAMSIGNQAQAQSYQWGGWFIGASADVFWNQPLEQFGAKPRVQVSKIYQVGLDPNIVAMPGLNYRSTTGEMGVEATAYHQFATRGNWRFLLGGGLSPLIVQMDNASIEKKGNVIVDLLADYRVAPKLGVMFGLRVDWQAAYSSTIPENEDLGTMVTFTAGLNPSFLGF